jgi:hypothetical protein
MTNIRVDTSDLARVGKYLKKTEPDVYKEIASQLRSGGRIVAANVAQNIKQPRLTRWHKEGRRGPSNLPGFAIGRAQAGVKPAVSPTGRRRGSTVTLLRIQQMDAGGAVFDSAGNKTQNLFSTNLDGNSSIKAGKGKIRSRSIYKGTKNAMPLIENNVAIAISIAEKKISDAIMAGF